MVSLLRGALFLTAALLLSLVTGVAATSQSTRNQHDDVQITLLEVPGSVVEGEDARFRCEFNSSLKMYSMKWYRDDKEFFYYIPSLRPQKRVIPMPGVIVDMARSNGRTLVLQAATPETEGRYKCEVSTEWPHYYTADRSHLMTVVVLPEEKPIIYGALDQYSLGDRVWLTCSSAPSKPRAKLSWYINEREAPFELLEPESPTVVKGQLEQSRLSLGFVVTSNHFIRGRLTLRCSSVVDSYTLHEELVFNVPVMDAEERAALAGHSTSNGATCLRENRALALLLSIGLFCWRNQHHHPRHHQQEPPST